MKVIQNKIFLWILPILYAYTAITIKLNWGPYWSSYYQYDPEYAYLENSLNILNGNEPHHWHHPGTTLQAIGAFIIYLKYHWDCFFNQEIQSLSIAVIKGAESYLTTINYSLIFLTVITLQFVGFKMKKYRGLVFALVFQSSVLFFWSVIFSFPRVSPEPLLVIICYCYFALFEAFEYHHSLNESKSKTNLAIMIGFCAGAGVVTKMTFIPLLFLLLILKSWKNKVIAFGTMVLSFLLLTLSIAGMRVHVWKWAKALITHDKRYGQGEKGVPSFLALKDNLISLYFEDQKFFIILILLFLFFALIFILKKQSSRFFKVNVQGSGVFLIVLSLQLIITIKHPAIRYLIPSMLLCGWWIARIMATLKLNHVFFGIIFILLGASGYSYKDFIFNRKNALMYVESLAKFREEHADSVFAFVPLSSAPESALLYADYYSGFKLQPDVFGVYPHAIFLDDTVNVFVNFKKEPVQIDFSRNTIIQSTLELPSEFKTANGIYILNYMTKIRRDYFYQIIALKK